jgi:hypothetical protein
MGSNSVNHHWIARFVLSWGETHKPLKAYGIILNAKKY